MENDTKNKPLVVITGASQGIGKALAIKFASENHPCLLISRHIEFISELENKQIIYENVDVTDYKALKSAIEKAEAIYGKTECIINNAGFINIGELRDMDVEKCSYEFDVLVKGVLNGIKAVLSDMSARKSGTIINVSSIGDRKPFPQAVCYHASKHAVRSMAESLQMAEAKNNVRVINVAPGLIKTNIHQNMGISFEEYSKNLGNPTFILPEELADIIMFCWKLPQHICIRDIAVMPTDCDF
ncbi:MAG: SDR family oxidoreductase [Candidatus Cloacimonadales bacterium]|nr:SDR family oxidoreductase [Candidatus Cloacimonadales bacterium]